MRICECGCGASLEGRDKRARYATSACRARGWKAKTGYGRHELKEVRSHGQPCPDQVSRVHRVLILNGSIGITQQDFLAPHVIDGMSEITRVPARINDLETKRGIPVQRAGRRNGFQVYRLPVGVA